MAHTENVVTNRNFDLDANRHVVDRPAPRVEAGSATLGNNFGSSTTHFGHSMEKLEGSSNFHGWKFAMKMTLKLEGLWPCVVGTDPDSMRDERALARICLSVKPSCYQYVHDSANAKAAWDTLSSVFESKGLFRRVLLLRQLHRAELGNSMSEYIDSIMSLVHQLADIGKNIEDGEVAEILLSGLTDKYDALVSNMETTCLAGGISSEFVRTRLLQEEFRKNGETSAFIV